MSTATTFALSDPRTVLATFLTSLSFDWTNRTSWGCIAVDAKPIGSSAAGSTMEQTA
jgi:hypothetical protein